jgi:TorA maturation chaperone TorD
MVASIEPERAGSAGAGELARLAVLRRDLYALFAGLLIEPADRAALDLLSGERTPERFAEDDEWVGRLSRAAREAPIEELRQEFWDLFVVPGKRFVAPAQSVYLDAREIEGERVGGLLMGDSAVAVQRALAAANLELDTARPLPPDHIAVELAFLSHLCDREWAAWNRGDVDAAKETRQAACRFLEEHVLRWLPKLRERVRDGARLGFYVALLDLVVRFAEEERLRLGSAHEPTV